MSVTIELNSDQQARLDAAARRNGIEPAEYATKLVTAQLPRVPHTNAISNPTTPQERAKAFRAWAESHSRETPLLSDEDISRESIYGERG